MSSGRRKIRSETEQAIAGMTTHYIRNLIQVCFQQNQWFLFWGLLDELEKRGE